IGNIREWIEEGGVREDDYTRSFHHFDDPLQPWNVSGLGVGSFRSESSIQWMQDGTQLIGGSWSWSDARRLYYEALTERDPRAREALWADTFRAVGQIMHLVVDASVPEHTRNDPHPLGAAKLGMSYERFVGDLP